MPSKHFLWSVARTRHSPSRTPAALYLWALTSDILCARSSNREGSQTRPARSARGRGGALRIGAAPACPRRAGGSTHSTAPTPPPAWPEPRSPAPCLPWPPPTACCAKPRRVCGQGWGDTVSETARRGILRRSLPRPNGGPSASNGGPYQSRHKQQHQRLCG